MKKLLVILPFVLILCFMFESPDMHAMANFGAGKAQAQTKYTYEVYAIGYARIAEPISLSAVAVGADSNETLDLHFMFWFLKRSDGRNILIDVGYLEDSPKSLSYSLPIVDYIRPDLALLKVGRKATEIDDIIISHMHWDHVDGIDLFPQAHVWIQKKEYEHYTGAAWQSDEKPRGVDARDVVKIVKLNTSGRLSLIEGDGQEIIEGITVYTGARHSYSSQYVVVETEDNKIVLASDCLVAYGSMGRRTPDFLTFDAAADLVAQDRMRSLASRDELIVPGHDGKVFTRFPNPIEWVARIK
jgi:glyoxylase-like metal-dependent hydrolase (beta-lactamase superfamily II)